MLETADEALSDPLRAVVQGVRTHPHFEAAALAYVDNVIAWRRSLGYFNRVGTNLAFHVIGYTLYLHASAQVGRIEHGATFSQLLEICERRGNGGARALRTILAVLRAMGWLKAEQAAGDARVQIYVPSDALLNEFRDINGCAMGVLDCLVPGSHFSERMRKEPNFIFQVMAPLGRAVVEGHVTITERFPHLHTIIMQAGGLPTSISLARAQLRDEPFPAAAQIARDFSLSATQVRVVIAKLSECRLIDRRDTGEIVDARPLVEEHLGLIAREVAAHATYALGLGAKLTVPQAPGA